MCARIYVIFKLNWSSIELKQNTKLFRDNEKELKKLQGFEAFYENVLTSWIEGQKKKPLSSFIQLKKESKDVTLLIKCCAMDAPIFEIQIDHIIGQLCSSHKYYEVVLLLDSRRRDFLREHNGGDYDKIINTGRTLLKNSRIDRFLIAPTNQESQLIENVYECWFGIRSKETHSVEGVPIFSQLWAFEKITTRYVLQLDIDVLICRRSYKHDYLQEMLKVIKEKNVFSVGFNIPHALKSKFKKYSAPKGGFTPEVRFGLLDLKRLKRQKPFPNSVSNGCLDMTWYRSVECYQKQNGWKSTRGGSPKSFYIHPPNTYKTDIDFHLLLYDLVEQDRLPEIQYDNWDVVGQKKDWSYSVRNEELIVFIMERDTSLSKIERCLNSLFTQKNTNWGAIIVDDASNHDVQRYLIEVVSEHKNQVTLVNRKIKHGKTRNEWELLNELCANPESLIIILDMDDCFIHDKVLEQIHTQYIKGFEIILGGMFRPDKPLKRYEVRFGDLDKPDAGNVWIHLRSFRYRLFSKLTKEQFQIDGKWIEYCDEYAMMIPMVKMAHKKLAMEEYLYFHERSTPNTNHIREKKDQIIEYYTNARIDTVKRSTAYSPNMKRIEIDITYICNLNCVGCDRSCSHAPEALYMPTQTIEDFLYQTDELGHKWESIRVLGGEPTLHPQFLEIVTTLDSWFKRNSPSTELRVISNGYSRKTKDILKLLPNYWRHENSYKNSEYNHYFEPFNSAPIDLTDWQTEDFSKGCWISQYCGIGLTPFGYFPCAVSGGIERIFGFGNKIRYLPENGKLLKELYSVYCKYCGHFFSDRHYSTIPGKKGNPLRTIGNGVTP